MTGTFFINDVDAFETWGITFDSSALSALMTPPPMKENIKTTSRIQNGSTVLTTNPRMAARQVTITFNIQAVTEQQFIARYNSFCNVLKNGFFSIHTKYQPSVWYHLEYNSCSQFQEYRRTLAKFVLKCTENRPDLRTQTITV